MAVLKGIIGAVVVSIEGRKSLYKEQRRVLEPARDRAVGAARCARRDARRGLRRGRDGCRAPARHRRPGREPHRPARDRLARPARRRGGCGLRSASGRPARPSPAPRRVARPPRAADGGPHPAGRRRRGEGAHQHRRHHRRAGRAQERRRRRDEGPVPLPRRAQPELQRAPAGGLLPLLRLRRVRRRLLVPPQDGPRLVHRGGRAPRRRASATRCTTRTGERRPTPPDAPACTPRTPRRRSSSARQLATAEAGAARSFLGERGFDAGAAAHFGVGYAPEGLVGHALRAARARASPTRSSARPGSSRRDSAASTTGSAAA